jgi:hypothetical protein
MADIVISAVLAVLTIAMAYLGVHVTLHPKTDSPKEQFWYKSGFFACGIIAVSLVIVQGVRSVRTQRSASKQIASLQTDVKAARDDAQSAKTEAAGARRDAKDESSRRQQAERDLLIAIQGASAATRKGVAEEIRNNPVKVEVNGQEAQSPEEIKRKQAIKDALSGYMMRGLALKSRCSTDPPNSTLEQDAQAWLNEVAKYLSNNLGVSYVNQFALLRATAFEPNGVPSARVSLWKGIDQRIDALDRFIDGLK